MARKKKGAQAAGSGWLTTYGDMVTLMLCFFVMLYEPTEVDMTQLAALSASISGDPTGGAVSLAAGRLADLGNTISSMPSMEKGARAINVLHYLTDFGAQENKFSIAAYADTRSVYSNDTEEGRAYNRRVDIIILDEAHF